MKQCRGNVIRMQFIYDIVSDVHARDFNVSFVFRLCLC